MAAFISRIKQWRLRWKIAPFALLIAIVGLSFYMRRPLVDFTLEKVTQEGDWIRIEFNLTNTSNELVSVTVDSRQGSAALWLEYIEKIPVWWGRYQRFDDNSLILEAIPVDKIVSETRDLKRIKLLKNESVKVVGYLHSEAADFSFIFLPPYQASDSRSSRLERWIIDKENKAGKAIGIVRWVRENVYDKFTPDHASRTFNPSAEISERTGEVIEERISTFLNQPVPAPCEYLVKQNEAYLNLKNFNENGWEQFKWESKSWDKWQDQIMWSLYSGLEPDPQFQGRSQSFYSAFWQDFDKFGPEIKNAQKYLSTLESVTYSLRRNLVERFNTKRRRELLRRLDETGLTPKEYAEQWNDYEPDD